MKNKINCGSGKVLGISGVTNALIPPPIPQKKDTSKNIPEYQGLTPADYPGDNDNYLVNDGK